MLPELAELTDPDGGSGALERAAGRPLGSARVRYLEHNPGRSFLVHLRVPGAPTAGDVVAGGDVADGGDVVASRTLHGPRSGAGLQLAWFPADLALPLLADPARLAELLGLDPADEPELLAWTPQHRAVLRAKDVVVKLYATPAEAVAARDHLVTVSTLVPSARLVRADVEAGAVVQTRLAGPPLLRRDALGSARDAARLGRLLHAGPRVATGLGHHRPEHHTAASMLRLCEPVTRLVSFTQPELAERIDAVTARLRETAAPSDAAEAVLSHGDFTWGQLLRAGDGQLALLDTDTLCLAPAAFDLASYAANLVSGRPDDLALALRVLDELVRGYDGRPPGLEWWLAAVLLRRLDRPVRRLKRDWPSRAEALLEAAERTVG